MLDAVLFACALLAVGCVLRVNLRLLQLLFVPASVVAGAVGLAVLQWGLSLEPDAATGAGAAAWGDWFRQLSEQLRSWPGWLIAVVFAALLLERKSRPLGESARLAGREGVVVWIIVLGQTTIGLLATWLLLKPLFGVPDAFGMLIETGFAGGHGTAAAMGEVFALEGVGLADGRDLGMMMATIGLVISVTTGIAYINIAVRRGMTRQGDIRVAPIQGLEDRAQPPVVARGRIRPEVMEPMMLQVLFLAAAMAAGIGMERAVGWAAQRLDAWGAWNVDAAADGLTIGNIVGSFPLFIYTLFGGLLVRKLAERLAIGDLIDAPSIQRLVGAAMELLVVSAIATLNLTAVAKFAGPLAILVIAALLWTAFCLFFVARWFLPQDYWFELGLINYGMSTGTTATGFVLLRVIDKHLDSGAAEDYALAAPLSSPFVGGGLFTLGLPMLVLPRWPLPAVCLALLAAMAALFLLARTLRDR